MGVLSKLAGICFATITLGMVATLARGVVPGERQHEVEGLHRVLDQPTLLSRRIETGHAGEKSICFELGWSSRWKGGPLEVRGSLLLEHREHPAGRIIACQVDAARLNKCPVWKLTLPFVEGDESTMVLCDAELSDLRVLFSSRR